MKVLVAGDLHGSARAARQLVHAVRRTNAEMVWQVGDFGYWPGLSKEKNRKFLDTIESVGIPVLFADGNHEDHTALESHSTSRGMRWLRGNVAHVKRGTVVDVDNLRVLFYGGAVSVDQDARTPGYDWFLTETPSIEQMELVLSHDPVDIVVAHDAPGWVDFGYPLPANAWWPEAVLRQSLRHREHLSEVAEKLSPSVWFAGHHHVRRSAEFNSTRAEVLNCDGFPGTFAVYDTITGEVTSGH